MQIHTDVLRGPDFYRATSNLDGVYVDIVESGSRSRARKFDLTLSANPRKGRRPRNSNREATGDAAATWDEWGVVLARLFDIDPAMTIPQVYENPEHFHWTTGNRFVFGDHHPDVLHDQHRWEYDDVASTDIYSVHECMNSARPNANTCGAVRRFLMSMTWSEFQEFTS